jgi:hypothetical protein
VARKDSIASSWILNNRSYRRRGADPIWSGGTLPYQVQNAANLSGASGKISEAADDACAEDTNGFVIWVVAKLMLRFIEEALINPEVPNARRTPSHPRQ